MFHCAQSEQHIFKLSDPVRRLISYGKIVVLGSRKCPQSPNKRLKRDARLGVVVDLNLQAAGPLWLGR
jgi:hypothetical protein